MPDIRSDAIQEGSSFAPVAPGDWVIVTPEDDEAGCDAEEALEGELEAALGADWIGG